MKYSPQIKTKIFAQYFGQKVKDKKGHIFPLTLMTLSSIVEKDEIEDCKLLLKSTLKIKDEDALKIAELLEYDTRSKPHAIAAVKENLLHSIKHNYKVYQYLQLEGYDLPYTLLNDNFLYDEALCEHITT